MTVKGPDEVTNNFTNFEAFDTGLDTWPYQTCYYTRQREDYWLDLKKDTLCYRTRRRTRLDQGHLMQQDLDLRHFMWPQDPGPDLQKYQEKNRATWLADKTNNNTSENANKRQLELTQLKTKCGSADSKQYFVFNWPVTWPATLTRTDMTLYRTKDIFFDQ